MEKLVRQTGLVQLGSCALRINMLPVFKLNCNDLISTAATCTHADQFVTREVQYNNFDMFTSGGCSHFLSICKYFIQTWILKDRWIIH